MAINLECKGDKEFCKYSSEQGVKRGLQPGAAFDIAKDALEKVEQIVSEEHGEDFIYTYFTEGSRSAAELYLSKLKSKPTVHRVDIEEDAITEDCFICGDAIDSQSQLQGLSTCNQCREKKE